MSYIPPIILDGKPVEKITAFLFDQGGNENPATLLANANKSFVGSYVLGMGFTFDIPIRMRLLLLKCTV